MCYELLKAGSIRSALIRKPGNQSGRRLFNAQSIREFLATQQS